MKLAVVLDPTATTVDPAFIANSKAKAKDKRLFPQPVPAPKEVQQ